ncbi:hypothetical protein VO69_04255 [Aeromonas salmonicida]|nr:hypothetical protein VO69_04255 [Aeromonas salmonicida]
MLVINLTVSFPHVGRLRIFSKKITQPWQQWQQQIVWFKEPKIVGSLNYDFSSRLGHTNQFINTDIYILNMLKRLIRSDKVKYVIIKIQFFTEALFYTIRIS